MNPLNKLIGLIVSAVVIIGVSGTTIFQENNKTSFSSSASNNLFANSTSTSTQLVGSSVPIVKTPLVATPVKKTIATTKTTYVKKCTTSARSGDDDEGGTTTCVNVPVTTTVNTPASIPVHTTTVASTPPPATTPKQYASIYKDGTYTATGSYDSPAGYESISVTVTLANDIITSSSVTPLAQDRTSMRYQNYFISGYKSYVVGQNIANVNLTYVSGSSLTPTGFNSALSQIMTQAKA